MNIIFVALTLLIEKSCSQTLSKSHDCFSNGGELTLNCETTDFTKSITFFLNTVPQGGCVSSICADGLAQSGTTVTSKTISAFNDSAHSGSWTCKYGGSDTSNILIIAENPCSTDTKCGWCRFECDHIRWCIVLIVICVLLAIGVIMGILIKRECCCFSNDSLRTRNRCFDQQFNCLRSTETGDRTNANNQPPHTGRNMNEVRPLPPIGERH